MYLCTQPPKIYHTPSSVWSKTTLNTGGVGGAGGGQPTCKPIMKNFQLNGAW